MKRDTTFHRLFPAGCMVALVVVLGCCAIAALAEELHYEDTPGGEQVGILTYHNELTPSGWGLTDTVDATIQTDAGPLVVRTTRTRNDQCATDCPDLIEVIRAPDGTVAVPGVVELPEGGEAQVRIMNFEGM